MKKNQCRPRIISGNEHVLHHQFPRIVQGLVQRVVRLAGCHFVVSHEQDDDVDEQQAEEDEGEVDDEIL